MRPEEFFGVMKLCLSVSLSLHCDARLIMLKMFRQWQLEVDCRGIMGTTLEVEEEGTTVNADDEDPAACRPAAARVAGKVAHHTLRPSADTTCSCITAAASRRLL